MAIEEDVIGAIKAGKAKMRPKAYFVLRAAIGVLSGVIAFLLLVYLVSFVVFALRESGIWFEPSFGPSGLAAFFRSLPWVLLALIAVLFVALAALVRRYQFGHRWPIVYSLIGVIFLVATGNLLIAQTSLRAEMFRDGVNERLPIVGEYYEGFAVPSVNDIHRGQVLTPFPGGFILSDLRGATSAVLVASATRILPGASLEPGSVVVVFGDRDGSGTIQAVGISEISH